MNKYKAILIQVICSVIVLSTSVFLANRLYGVEKIALGLFGFAIMIGSLVEAYKDIDELKTDNRVETMTTEVIK